MSQGNSNSPLEPASTAPIAMPELNLPIVLDITGASGVVYATRLLQALLSRGCAVHLTVSDSGAAVIRQELRFDAELDVTSLWELLSASDRLLGIEQNEIGSASQLRSNRGGQSLTIHHYKDYFTPIASGSFLTAGMVICPCSGSTLAGVAHASSQNLIQRAAEVHLKERRKLIVVPRETPVSTLQLENMLRLSQAGGVVLPAAPGWYHGVSSLRDLVDFIVGRILDQLGIANTAFLRWSSPGSSP